MKASLILLLFFLAPFQSLATGPALTYHGRLLKPDGVTPVSANVQFRIQIRSPGTENCLLWEEIQTQDLTSSAGVFVVGINDGSGTRTDGGTQTFSQIMANNQALTVANGNCVNGTTYSPSASDGRHLIVSFNDGTFTGWEDSPAQALNYAPKAIDALQVADGTLAVSLSAQPAHQVLAAPQGSSGAPTFRSFNISDLMSSIGGSFLTGTTCSAGQALTYSVVTDTIACTSLSLSSGQVTWVIPRSSITAQLRVCKKAYSPLDLLRATRVLFTSRQTQNRFIVTMV
jgi:hypothetical protein